MAHLECIFKCLRNLLSSFQFPNFGEESRHIENRCINCRRSVPPEEVQKIIGIYKSLSEMLKIQKNSLLNQLKSNQKEEMD